VGVRLEATGFSKTQVMPRAKKGRGFSVASGDSVEPSFETSVYEY